jgi:hypothetical protein
LGLSLAITAGDSSESTRSRESARVVNLFIVPPDMFMIYGGWS